MAQIQNIQVRRYYDSTRFLYNSFWHRSLHLGYWDKDTKNLRQALDNNNEFFSRLLGIKKGGRVLDAGCGTGETVIYMARTARAHATGITISEKQAEQAKRRAAKMGVSYRTSFAVMDFSQTAFGDETFAGVFAMESACYAPDKAIFLREMHRLLKPGGKIVIEDPFLIRRELSSKELRRLEVTLRGHHMPPLCHRDDFWGYLEEAGFRNIRLHDKTADVERSRKISRRLGFVFLPVCFALSKLRIVPQDWYGTAVSMIKQGKEFEKFVMLGVFVAEK